MRSARTFDASCAAVTMDRSVRQGRAWSGSGGSPSSIGEWLKQGPIDLVVVVRRAESSCVPAWWREAAEWDREGARFATSKAARSRACEAKWGHTAGVTLCFVDQTSKIFQF
jgi:hypothetical protein